MIKGNVQWTDEGYLFSWHMMLKQKQLQFSFYLYDPVTKSKVSIENEYEKRLPGNMLRPEMMLQLANYHKALLKEKQIVPAGMESQHMHRYEIRGNINASLNYRPFIPIVDPEADLSRENYSLLKHNDWILLQDDTLKKLKPIFEY